MPELPDLTVFAKNLNQRVRNRPITQVQVFNAAKVNPTEATLRGQLMGESIQEVQRDGKELVFVFTPEKRLAMHMMLFGRLSLVSPLEAFRINSKILMLVMEGEEALILSDQRAMARAALNPKPNLTPDAMSEAFTWEYFQKIVQKKTNANIKALLIDQHVVKGIGNAYVDEILWKASVSPKSIAGRIPEEVLRAIYDAIPWVMQDAIEQIERIAPDIIAGEERSFLRVHRPRAKTTPRGEPIRCEEVAGKRTYYTDQQRLFV